MTDQNGMAGSVIVPVAFDYVGLSLDSTHDIWTYRVGGSSGDVVGIITITYTDSTKQVIANIQRTNS